MTGKYVDFKEVKERVSIDQVLPMLTIPALKQHGDQWRGGCPSCKQGGDRALVVTKSKGVFFCFSAREGGDVIALVAHVRGISARDAAIAIAEQFRVGTGTSTTATHSGNGSPSPSPGFSKLDYLECDHPAVSALGFDAGTAEALGVGYAGKGILRGLVAVPVRLEDGQLAGYIGITEAKLPNRWHGIPESNVVQLKKNAG